MREFVPPPKVYYRHKEKYIVAISGKARSGKTTLAEILEMKVRSVGLKYDILSFADGVYDTGRILTGVHISDYKGTRLNGKGFTCTGGELLQHIGEGMKEVFGEHVWVNALHNALEESTADVIIIPDLRFLAENEYIDNFTMKTRIRVNRTVREPSFRNNRDRGETFFDDYEHFDHILTDITLEEAERFSEDLAKKIKSTLIADRERIELIRQAKAGK